MSTAVIRVVIIAASPFMYCLLMAHRRIATDIQIVGTASNATRALTLVKDLHPDVVTLDLQTPKLDGLSVLEHVMYACPTPVVLVGSAGPDAAALTLKGMEMGAVDCILQEPPQNDSAALCHHIVAKIRAASRIHVIRSLRRHHALVGASAPGADANEPGHGARGTAVRVVVVGASTGGPTALRVLLSALPAAFPAAIVVVQHIPDAFAEALAAQLGRYTPLPVCVAAAGCRLEAGAVLVAPGGTHLMLGPDASVILDQGAVVGGHCPCIDVTMQSVAQVYGRRALGIVLTGMGADGAQGLMAIHAAGGATFAQDADSCLVDGMPQQARATGVVDYIGTPAQIAHRLCVAPWAHRRNET